MRFPHGCADGSQTAKPVWEPSRFSNGTRDKVPGAGKGCSLGKKQLERLRAMVARRPGKLILEGFRVDDRIGVTEGGCRDKFLRFSSLGFIHNSHHSVCTMRLCYCYLYLRVTHLFDDRKIELIT